MTRDQIIQWRHLADAYARNQSSDHYEQREISDERFAQLARADEREACAKVCEGYAVQVGDVAWIAASAIRSRKDDE